MNFIYWKQPLKNLIDIQTKLTIEVLFVSKTVKESSTYEQVTLIIIKATSKDSKWTHSENQLYKFVIY